MITLGIRFFSSPFVDVVINDWNTGGSCRRPGVVSIMRTLSFTYYAYFGVIEDRSINRRMDVHTPVQE